MGATHTCPPTTVPTPAHQPLWLLRLGAGAAASLARGEAQGSWKPFPGSLGNQLPLLRRWRRRVLLGFSCFPPPACGAVCLLAPQRH